MFEEYTKIEKNFGQIFVNDKSVGTTYYEFVYNPYNTNEMHVLLVNPPIGFIAAFNNKIRIRTDFLNTSYSLFLDSKQIEYNSNERNRTISCVVDKFVIERNLPKEKDESYIYLGFYFPLTGLTNNNVGFIKHSDYGLIRGDYNFDKDEVTLRKSDFLLNTKYGEFKIINIFEFIDLPSSELYKQLNLINRSICSLRIPFNETSFNDDIADIENYNEVIFAFISFIERDRINWSVKHIRIHNHLENTDKTFLNYRWCAPVSASYHKDKINKDLRKKTLQLCITAFDKLSVEKKENILELMKNIQIANCSSTIETKLIHFHSCLDFFRNKYHKKNSFSKDLIDLLDENNVRIDDLIAENTLTDIRMKVKNKSTFTFTEFRNSYIHDGFSAFKNQYNDVLKSNDIMRCICERLLLSRIGINYNDTVLGKID